jgi:hypothetical protein
VKHVARILTQTPLVSHEDLASRDPWGTHIALLVSLLRLSNVEVREASPGGGLDSSLLEAGSLTRRVRPKKQAAGTTRLF